MKTECSRTRLCGDIEAANGSFKRAVEQHLLLRGSRDFHRLHEYEAFLWHIMDKRNDLRSERLAEELAVMKLLVAKPWPEMRELRPRVSRGGTVRVLNNIYSVPSGLKGKQVRVRVFEWHIEIWYTNQWIENIPRLTGINHHRVHYRHVIDTLLRKPGGFRNYRYRDDLFPQIVFRQAWEVLQKRYSPRRADISYLRILKLAAHGSEADVAAVLENLLDSSAAWDDQTVAEQLEPAAVDVPVLQSCTVQLSDYDQLLQMGVHSGTA